MADIKSEVIEHDGGWAYSIGGLISRRFPSHSSALIAGVQAADEHQAQSDIREAADGSPPSRQEADAINKTRE